MLFNNLSNLSNLNLRANRDNLGILNRVRSIAIIGQIVVIIFAIVYLDILLPIQWLSTILIAEMCLQFYSIRSAGSIRQISNIVIFFHILFDSLILGGLIYFTGGANNPFIYLLLLSIALGTYMLTPLLLLLITGLALLLYSLLNIYPRPLELGDAGPLASFHLHLTGMWVNFALTAVLIAIFGMLSRITQINQEKQLQELREKQLKDEQILSLGIMSASAAHELGTPLATMAIIVDDLNHVDDVSDRIHSDMKLLASQIRNCRNIIQALNDKNQNTREQLNKLTLNSNASSEMNLKQQILSVIDNWNVYRPQIILKQSWSDDCESINSNLSISVEQAFTNLLNNSADASLDNNSDKVELSCSIEKQQLVIEIIDFGKGISQKLRSSLGESIQETNKAGGFGWGLFLSNASIERIKGKVYLLESVNGGTLTRINLPLDSLL